MAVEYCPVSMGVDLLGEKWTLLIVREIITGAHHFNEIHRGLPGLSRTLLSSRLRLLERADVVTKTGRRYDLTPAGDQLIDIIMAFGTWTVRWRFPQPEPGQSDPYLLMWRMRAGVIHEHIPDRRIVIHLAFTDPHAHGWLVLHNGEVGLCTQDPHYVTDLTLSGDTAQWYAIWYWHTTIAAAADRGDITVDGPRSLTESLHLWFARSAFAEQVATRR